MATTTISPRRERFIAAYLRTMNATEACVEAGYSSNRATARVTGSRLLADANISQTIARRHQAAMQRQELSLDAVLQELKTILHADVRKLLNGDGTVKDISTLDDATAASISSLDVGSDGVAKIRTFDKVRAAELLIKRLGGPETHLHMVATFSPDELSSMTDEQLDIIQESNERVARVRRQIDG